MFVLWYEIAVFQFIVASIVGFWRSHESVHSRRRVRQHIRVGVSSFILVFVFSHFDDPHIVDEGVRFSFILIWIDAFWRDDGRFEI